MTLVTVLWIQELSVTHTEKLKINYLLNSIILIGYGKAFGTSPTVNSGYLDRRSK